MKTITFVCTGNTCRSPMAAALLQRIIEEQGLGKLFTAESAGVDAEYGSLASPKTLQVMEEIGINLSSHRAKPVTEEVVSASETIYVMSRGHKIQLLSRFLYAQDKVFLLGNGIADPYGGGIDEYRLCRERIEKLVCRFADDLARWQRNELPDGKRG